MKKNIYLFFRQTSFPRHHGHELVKVDRAGAVLVHLVHDLVQVVLVERGVDLTEDLLEDARRDVAVALLVVDTEGLPQLPPHLLLVLLDQKLGRQLDELGKLQAARLVLVYFRHDLLKKQKKEVA